MSVGLSGLCCLLQDNPLPWVVGDPRLLNPGIHVGSQLDRLVEGKNPRPFVGMWQPMLHTPSGC